MTIDLPTAMFILAFVTLLVSGGTMIWRLSSRLAEQKSKVDGHEEWIGKVEKQGQQNAGDLSNFRETVARDYASRDAIKEMEGRLVQTIERLGDRLDRLFEARKPT